MTLFVDPLQKPPAYIYALTVLVMLAFSLPGGLANHIRGGWLNLGQGSPALDENVLTHDGMLRFIMAFPSALLVGGMTLRLRRAFGLGFVSSTGASHLAAVRMRPCLLAHPVGARGGISPRRSLRHLRLWASRVLD